MIIDITKIGGPAFPSKYFDHQLQRTRVLPGMTLRDYFAAQALQALLSREELDGTRTYSELAYKHADAMLKARNE